MIMQYVVWVVKYKEKFYVWWNPNASIVRLIDSTGKKVPISPLEKELTKVKSIPCHMIHGGIYFKTKIGVFSGLNGDKITKDFITNLIS